MKRFIIVLLSVLLVVSVSYGVEDQPRGRTADDQSVTSENFVDDPVTVGTPSGMDQPISDPVRPKPMGADEWTLFDSTAAIRTCIPVGDHYAIRFDLPNRRLTEELPENDLSEDCMAAVERAPKWLQNDLIINLNRIRGEWAEFFQEFAVEAILDAEDPYVDEVAFCIAHMSPPIMEDGDVNYDLFIENAESIYEADEYLDYVQIVDHGEVGDDDYWTTLVYQISDGEDTTEVELDREIYYWYVVFPRLSDEAPWYIEPSSGSIQDPPRGVFWRDFLLNHPDDGYRSLREDLEDCGVLWSGLRNNATAENGAIGMITGWIRHILRFTSEQERPIQPVRIYNMHIGRCGEHSDMTAAAGRAALIPTLCTSVFCNDHTWNEFWGGDRWVAWEPVNNMVDSPFTYENGWGQIYPTVLNWRSDSYLYTVTDRYSEGVSDLNVTVRDRSGNPVDGAKLLIASQNPANTISWCGYGYTNSDGEVSLKIGDARDIYACVESPLGRVPNNGLARILRVEENEGGQVYEWTPDLWGRMPSISINEADEPENPTNHFRVNVSYELLREIANNSHGWRTNTAEFFVDVGPGLLDFFICNEENYQSYLDNDRFEAFGIEEIEGSGEIEFTLPTDGVWYVVFSNDDRLENWMEVEVATRVFYDDEFVDVADSDPVPASYQLYQNFPNPFNARTGIRFDLQYTGQTTITIYDVAGHQLNRLTQGILPAGRHEITFDGSALSSGTYFYEIECNGFVQRKSMVLLK